MAKKAINPWLNFHNTPDKRVIINPYIYTPIVFDPLSLSPDQWFDASDPATMFTTTAGSTLTPVDGFVRRWEDKSGNGRHATVAADTKTRKASVQNSKDGILNSGQQFTITSFDSATVAFVCAPQSAINALSAILRSGTSTNTIDVSESQWRYRANTFSASSTLAGNQAYLMTRNGTLTSAWRNGVAQTGGTTESLLFSGDRFINSSFVGHVFEVIRFARVLTSTEIADLNNYLISKWGL